jgi:MFS family permease
MLRFAALQGMGSSGILCLGDVIIADMVPLNERGLYTGLLSVVFVVAAAIGPLIGGTYLHFLSS